MLSAFDDYPIHQTPDPIAHPATGDGDFYERYWFNGYDKEGGFYLGVGAALYPHQDMQDCGVSLVIDGVQYAFHGSARANIEREIAIGPFKIEVVEPMRSMRVTLEANDTDMACDLLFEGRTATIEEPRHHFGNGIRRTMDTTRFAQFGTWSGWIEFDGKRLEINPATTWGTKDRSWGTRPIGGGDKRGAPQQRTGGLFFLWAPLHFDDLCTHYQLFEDTRGRPLFQVGAALPVYNSSAEIPGVEDPGVQVMRNNEHALLFEDGLRMAASGTTVAMTAIEDGILGKAGDRIEIEFDKIFTYQMKGIGYSHPEWGHGMWKGELEMMSEKWNLDDVDLTRFENQHVQHLMKVTMGDRTGIGVLEQVMYGPYAPYGFEGVI